MTTAGSLVRDARQRHGLSQARLARRAGTTQAAVSRIERGLVSPTVTMLNALLRAVGERLELSAVRIESGDDPAHLAELRKLTPEQRLDQAVAFARLAATYRGAAGRGLDR